MRAIPGYKCMKKRTEEKAQMVPKTGSSSPGRKTPLALWVPGTPYRGNTDINLHWDVV